MNHPKTIAIDEEGYFLLPGGIRVTDEKVGHDMLAAISKDDFGVLHLDFQGEQALVEAFDKPYVALQVHLEEDRLVAQMPYQLKQPVIFESFCVDEWDRFHCQTENGIPVVFSRTAQAELFNIADSFDDDSVFLKSKKIMTPHYYQTENETNAEPFWTNKYNENPSPPWNLDKVHPELPSLLQQLKVNKCRVLVPGCGYGHDAAYFAKQGHIVTAIDISPNAIEKAKSLYGHIDNLEFVVADAFNLDDSYKKAFDIIFEHTFYCAVSPFSRDEVVKLWKSWLADTGHLLGIFFVVPKRTGPYFGGSEWELREKLQSRFNFLYWTRLKASPGWRKGAELSIYAQLKES